MYVGVSACVSVSLQKWYLSLIYRESQSIALGRAEGRWCLRLVVVECLHCSEQLMVLETFCQRCFSYHLQV